MTVTPDDHCSMHMCRITVDFASGEERTRTFLMFVVRQIVFRARLLIDEDSAYENS